MSVLVCRQLLLLGRYDTALVARERCSSRCECDPGLRRRTAAKHRITEFAHPLLMI